MYSVDATEQPYFPADAVPNFSASRSTAEGEISSSLQWFSPIGADQHAAAPSYIVKANVDNSDGGLADKPHPRQHKTKGPGRPPKRGRPAKPKPDRRRRTLEGPLDAADRRDLLDAVAYADHAGMTLDTTIDVHPAFLDTYPSGELREWFVSGPWRAAGRWLERHGVGWAAIATRESYQGERREHLHIVCECPACLRGELHGMLRRCFPGDPRTFRVGELGPNGVTYRLKQSLGNAMGPPRRGRPTHERHSRHDGTSVAAVTGKRYMISRSLARSARDAAGWQARRDEARAVAKIERVAKQRTRLSTSIDQAVMDQI